LGFTKSEADVNIYHILVEGKLFIILLYFDDLILKIESDILGMEGTSNVVYSSLERKEHLIKLETKKIQLLRQQEETWRLKSRAI